MCFSINRILSMDRFVGSWGELCDHLYWVKRTTKNLSKILRHWSYVFSDFQFSFLQIMWDFQFTCHNNLHMFHMISAAK